MDSVTICLIHEKQPELPIVDANGFQIEDAPPAIKALVKSSQSLSLLSRYFTPGQNTAGDVVG